MRTEHRALTGDARKLPLPDNSVQLVVTSPPYPMIAMWDECFRALAPDCGPLLQADSGFAAWEAMHRALDGAWAECQRVLSPGGFLCINIGDATRSLGGSFALYPNHARILSAAMRLGLTPLPDILWRKPTNAPNKFMGSGMLPAGAYATYEHEYLLILRKGDKRTFTGATKQRRAESAFFWEERNRWFSDLWTDLPGVEQELREVHATESRQRSAAFPFELPYRLICMYSAYGDTVLDPFVGTGTTMAAALAAGRSSVGVEHEAALLPLIQQTLRASLPLGQRRARERLRAHQAFVAERGVAKSALSHKSKVYGFPVMTRQETQLCLYEPSALQVQEGVVVVEHGVSG